MPTHLSTRVPWHHERWDGTVCCDPAANCHCIQYENILARRGVALEVGQRGRLRQRRRLIGMPFSRAEGPQPLRPTPRAVDDHPNYNDPVEGALSRAIERMRPRISPEGAWAGAHQLVSDVDWAAGLTRIDASGGFRDSVLRIQEVTRQTTRRAVRRFKREPETSDGLGTARDRLIVFPWKASLPGTEWNSLTPELGTRMADAVRLVEQGGAQATASTSEVPQQEASLGNGTPWDQGGPPGEDRPNTASAGST
jgi:hypothetical protein